MRKSDLLAFARRDWQAVAEMKERYWADRMKRMTPEQALNVAAALRQHVSALRPDWPSEAERQEDLENHRRVSESLTRVRSTGHR